MLTGAGGDDHLVGGPGADKLNGGDGQDLLGGESGDDRWTAARASTATGATPWRLHRLLLRQRPDDIHARDGEREEINCGPGTDMLEADPIDVIYDSVTLVDQCEGHTGTPTTGGSSGAPAGAAVFGVTGAKVDRRDRIVVRFTAPGPGRASVRASARLSQSIQMTVGSASRTISQPGRRRSR